MALPGLAKRVRPSYKATAIGTSGGGPEHATDSGLPGAHRPDRARRSERRTRGGPSGGISPLFAEAGFGASEWLPDRTDDLALRLLTAAGMPDAEMLEAMSALLRATLSSRREPMLDAARARLPALLRWLEENARELLERT